jgi:hypothetical protein
VTEPLVARWRYTFHDLLTRQPLARLPLRDADLQEAIGQPSAGSGVVSLASDEVRARDPWSATTPRRTVCVAQRVILAGQREVAAPALWAGIVWKRARSGNALALTMATVESYWARRLAARNRTFSRTDDASIQRTVIADAQAVAYGNIGLALPAVTVGTRSDRTVAVADLKTVLELAQSIATNGAGFEWRIEPGVAADGRYTITLRQARTLGRPNVPGLRWVSAPDGRPGNELLGYELVEDGTDVPNRVVGLGGGQGADQLRSTQTAAVDTATGFPLLESALNSSTQDLLTQAALNRHTADALAALRADETQVSALTVRGDRGATVDTYGLGDTVTLELNDASQQHPPRILSGRIMARRILPMQPGRNETVAMTLGTVA